VPDTDLNVRLQPRAGRDEVVGERDGRVLIRVKAPPVDGRANEALEKLVAKRAGVPRSAVSVVRGHTSRDKVVRVEGIDAEALHAALQTRRAG
jgi:uncharacterized protein